MSLFFASNNTGLSLYAKFADSGGIVVQMIEGTGVDLRTYLASDPAVIAAALPINTAPGYNGTVLQGNYLSPLDTDQVVGTFSGFTWDGSTSSPAPNLGSSAVQFTSQEEIERLWSADGVALRKDDDAANSTIMEEIVDDATEMIYQYLWMNYAIADLNTSKWVRRRATFLGAWLLSQRRGNPGQYEFRKDQIIDELKLIYSCQLFIPGLSVSADGSPSLSNYLMDNRTTVPHSRVIAQESIGSYPGQDTYANPNVLTN